MLCEPKCADGRRKGMQALRSKCREKLSNIADAAESSMQWPHQFSDLRRKAKFIAAKMAPRTIRRGATPGPKAAARATIHSTIATVKIVQNTALSPDRVVTSKLQNLVMN